jgi:NTP pyrophosphatase (non-canonical NTP hydrolase)
VWFAEEVGELAHAIGKHDRGDADRDNLEEEFADVMAWLATMANICDVDLERAIARKYLEGGGPKGVK